MSLTNLSFGRPLCPSEEGGEKLGPTAGISIFGLDGLCSAAYGPEAALTLLIPLGTTRGPANESVEPPGKAWNPRGKYAECHRPYMPENVMADGIQR